MTTPTMPTLEQISHVLSWRILDSATRQITIHTMISLLLGQAGIASEALSDQQLTELWDEWPDAIDKDQDITPRTLLNAWPVTVTKAREMAAEKTRAKPSEN